LGYHAMAWPRQYASAKLQLEVNLERAGQLAITA
jgi:hypothetical protein